VEAVREHADLLSSVRVDIYQSSRGGGGADALLRERSSLHSANSLADGVIAQAVAAREALGGQRAVVVAGVQRLQGIGAQLPVVGGLIERINLRRRRDQIILAALIATLTFSLYLFH
jgi:Golgi SNAP receptor complex protein 1